MQCIGGERLAYDALVIATGASVRRLDVPGADLHGVHYLRTLEDSLAIRDEAAPGKRILVVGGGWIGLEAAASLRTLGADVILVETQPQLCARTMPPVLAGFLQRLHQEHGVEIRLNESVRRFSGGSRVEAAILGGGEACPISAAVIGIGIAPNDALARKAGLTVENGIRVDEYGRTSEPTIFAAGDVTNQPNRFLGGNVRLESWANAQNQAITVAENILGRAQPYQDVPWFWSDQYDVNLQLIGTLRDAEAAVLRGDPQSKKFATIFLKGNRIQGAAAVNNPRELRVIRKLMEMDRAVRADELADTGGPIQELLKP